MSDIVWQWFLNTYDDPGSLRLKSRDLRVLHCDSWYQWGLCAHTKMRLRYLSNFRWNAVGIRLV
jgi:hypothetical protein